VPRRRFQRGRVFLRGGRWVGSYRTYGVNPSTGKRMRRTITFDESVTSERAARQALQPYLAEYNARAKADQQQRKPPRTGKKVADLVDEWVQQILPIRKKGGARACASHIRTYIKPMLGNFLLRDLDTAQHQKFVTAVGLHTGRRRTTENIYCTLRAILKSGLTWRHFGEIPRVEWSEIEFPANLKPKTEVLHFDADKGAQIINAAPQPFKLMFLTAAIGGLRIGEVTALKVTSLDFKRKVININASLDYSTRQETAPKTENSAAPIPISQLLEKYLRDWVGKHYKPNDGGYLFVNSNGKPYRSDGVIKVLHRIVAKLGIQTPKGVHVGIHCFRHGVTTELLESTPIHVVTKLMRHGDPVVTLKYYAHVVSSEERAASERLSNQIGAQLESEPELESISPAKTA
jgi:integrase